MNWLGTGMLGSSRLPVAEGGGGDSDDDTDDQEPELGVIFANRNATSLVAQMIERSAKMGNKLDQEHSRRVTACFRVEPERRGVLEGDVQANAMAASRQPAV